MNTINTNLNVNAYQQQVGFDRLSETYLSSPQGSGSSALKGSLETQEMIQGEIAQMMKEITPHLGQNIDIEA